MQIFFEGAIKFQTGKDVGELFYPTEISKLTSEQMQNAVSLYFGDVQTFRLTLEVSSKSSISRRFDFGGHLEAIFTNLCEIAPTSQPTYLPDEPTQEPTIETTVIYTRDPTYEPTDEPTPDPTPIPTILPTFSGVYIQVALNRN